MELSIANASINFMYVPAIDLFSWIIIRWCGWRVGQTDVCTCLAQNMALSHPQPILAINLCLPKSDLFSWIVIIVEKIMLCIVPICLHVQTTNLSSWLFQTPFLMRSLFLFEIVGMLRKVIQGTWDCMEYFWRWSNNCLVALCVSCNWIFCFYEPLTTYIPTEF